MRQIAHSLRGGAGATAIRLKPSQGGRKHFIQRSDNQVEHLCFHEPFDRSAGKFARKDRDSGNHQRSHIITGAN